MQRPTVRRRWSKRGARAAASLTALAALVLFYAGFRLSTLYPRPLLGYNPEQDDVNGAAVPARWQGGSVTWEVNCTTHSNVQLGSGSGCLVETPLKAAFNAWNTTPLTSGGPILTGVQINEGSQTMLTDPDTSNAVDCMNVVSFVPSSTVHFPTGAIAFTAVATFFGGPTYNCTSGGTTTTKSCTLPACIIDADIMFNPTQQFSSAQPTPTNSFDVQSIATHEIGHLLGMDHSGIAHAVMYPFGDVGVGTQRTLAADDIIGIGFLYPSSSFASAVGTLSGNVTLNGTPTFAAHVVATDVATGNVVVDGLTDTHGNYSLDVPPGNYNLLALPLVGVYTLTDFGGWSCGYAGAMENAPPCCQPGTPMCTGTALSNPTNFTGTFLH